MKNLLKISWPFIALAILAFTLHLAFLSYPSQVVFDEVHFGKFVGAYSTGQYYFDIHPPLGKLMIAGFAKLAGVNSVFAFDKIGEAIPAKTLFILRFLPAFFGGLFVLAFSWLAWLISRNKTAALIAGFLILLDNAFLAQSKFILVDIFMLTFEVLTLCFFFLYQRQKNFSAKWWSYLALTAIFLGLTISIKWTGLAIAGIIGVVLFIKIFSQRLADYLSPRSFGHSERSEESLAYASRHKVGDSSTSGLKMIKATLLKEFLIGLTIILTIGFFVYLIPFYAHFQLLPHSGPGDAFMSWTFQQELKYGAQNYDEPLTFWQKFQELNQKMWQYNSTLAADHPFGSRWYSWPLDHKPVYYWNLETPQTSAKIYFAGNPVLWWLSAALIIFLLLQTLSKKGRRAIKPIFYILILGYFANLLPFILVKRVSFLYHYLPSATFAVLLFGLWLGKRWPANQVFVSFIIALVVLSFLITLPFSYGLTLPPAINQLELHFIQFLN